MPIEHIGIDVGPAGVRLVRVEAGFGTAVFRAYETRPLVPVPERPPGDEEPEAAREDEDAGDEEEREDEEPEAIAPWTPVEEAMQTTLAQVAGQGVFATQFTAAALGTGSLTTRLLTFPFTSRKKIDLVLEPEFESLTPFDAEDFLFDHATLGAGKAGSNVQAYAVPHPAMQRFMTGCENGHFDPRIVTATGAALAALPLAVEASLAEEAPEEAEPAENLHDLPRTAEEAWYRRIARRGEGEESEEKKITGARTLLESNACTALLYLGESETVLAVLREGSPWLLHASALAGPVLRGNDDALTALGKELRRVLLGFEANHGIGPDQIWALGAGAVEGPLLRALAKSTGLECEPGRLDREAAGDDAAAMLERHPESALAMGLAYLSARARQIPAPNFRRGPYAFRSRWRELAEPLAAPAILAAVALVLFLINSLVEFRNYRDEVQVARAQLQQLYTQARGKAPPEGVDPVQVLTAEVDEKRARLEIFRQISGISVLNILAELSRAIKPETPVDFENFRIDNDRVTINGKFDDYAALDKITGYLSDSKIFSKADFRDAVPGTDNKIKFRLSLSMVSATGEEGEDGEAPPTEAPAPQEEIPPFPPEEADAMPGEAAPADETDVAGLEDAPPSELQDSEMLMEEPEPPAPVQQQAEQPSSAGQAPDDGLTPAQRRVQEQLKLRQEREERAAERRRERLDRAKQGDGLTADDRRDARKREQFERIRERKERRQRAREEAADGGNGQ